MGTIKSWLIGFVKGEILSNLGMLDSLVTPELSALLQSKAKLPADQATALSGDVIAVLKTAITNLLNKL